MILKPCPFCHKDIPRAITVCPYCHRDEKGQAAAMDSSVVEVPEAAGFFEDDLRELSSEDSFRRDQAVVRVAQRGFGVVQALISILGDSAKPGLAGVAGALGRIGDRRAIPVLTQAAKMGDDELRMAAIWALAQFREPEVLPILIAESERPHPIIQSFLANVLGSYQDSQVVPALAKLSGHPNREVAFQAACALGETGDFSAVPALRKAWRRRDPLVRAAGAASLRRLGVKPSAIAVKTWLITLAILAAAAAAAAWFIYR